LHESDEKFLENMLNEAKAMDGIEMANLTVKLNGIILRKAELEGNFNRVYLKVFERMVKLEVIGSEDMTDILGEKGG
jgi:hypothetical protein